MDGWWKPLVSWAILISVILAFIAILEPPTWAELPVFGYVAVWLTPFVGLTYAVGALPVRRFLRGLRESGAHVEVVSDRLNWFGDRTTVVRTLEGDWLLETDANYRHASFQVTSPRGVRRRVRWSARKAGRRAVEDLHKPEEATIEARVRAWVTSPSGKSYRPHVVTGILLISGAALLVPAWGLGRTDDRTVRDLFWALHWFGIGMFWFFATAGGMGLGWHAVDDWDRLGRRAGGTLLYLGAATGLLAAWLLYAAAGFLRGEGFAIDWRGATAAALATLPAIVVLTWERGPVRLLNTLGIAAAAVAAWFAPAYFFGLCAAAILLLAFFQTWTHEPTTAAPDEGPLPERL